LMAVIDCIQDGEKLTLYSGQRHKTMRASEVDEYASERGLRGKKLPRGYRSIQSVTVEKK